MKHPTSKYSNWIRTFYDRLLSFMPSHIAWVFIVGFFQIALYIDQAARNCAIGTSFSFTSQHKTSCSVATKSARFEFDESTVILCRTKLYNGFCYDPTLLNWTETNGWYAWLKIFMFYDSFLRRKLFCCGLRAMKGLVPIELSTD